MTRHEVDTLTNAVQAALPLAENLFRDLREKTADGDGVSRESYGQGEHYAHQLIADAARSLDLEVVVDFAGNLYMTLPGRDRSLRGWLTGSHLDSVPNGGNYDGAAHARHLPAEPQENVSVVDRVLKERPGAHDATVLAPFAAVVALDREELVVSEDDGHQAAEGGVRHQRM